jgi:hypothetical protein
MFPTTGSGEFMRLSEMIVAINSLKWDIETFKKLKDDDINYYGDVLSEVQNLIINIDR